MDTWSFNEHGDCLRWLSCYEGDSPLLYIHGLGCASSSDYPTVMTSWEYADIPSLLIDLPGAGYSDKPEAADYSSSGQAALLQQWISSSGFSGITLFGHSAGAFIALKLAKILSPAPVQLLLCTPGLNAYGTSLLEEITAMSQAEFVEHGFRALMAQLKNEGGNEAWLGPFQVCSPQAVWQWAYSSLYDNNSDWMTELSALNISKGVILPDSASTDEVSQYLAAGCRIELVPESGHMMAYDNPDGLATAITKLTGHQTSF